MGLSITTNAPEWEAAATGAKVHWSSMSRHPYPVVMCVGGTDPSGGAGLSADILMIAACGVHPAPVVSAVTAQSSTRVDAWEAVPPELFSSQIAAVIRDGGIDAVKSGMLPTGAHVRELARALTSAPLSATPYVLDPVSRASSGKSLREAADPEALVIELLLPRALLVTPNLEEAAWLAGLGSVSTPRDMELAGEEILARGAAAVMVKGGHLAGLPRDLLVTRSGSRLWFEGRRPPAGGHVHGTGCALASAIASYIAAGASLEEAVAAGRRRLQTAIDSSFRSGDGLLPGHMPPLLPGPPLPDGEAFYESPRYCSRCGAVMGTLADQPAHLVCRSCGLVHYRNPLPAVALLLLDASRDSVLLVRRAIQPGRGMLSLPGGFLERGETIEQCARRELLEETGLEAGELALETVESDRTAYGDIVLVAMRSSTWNGEAAPGDDASEVIWTRIDSVPELAFPSHDRLVARLAASHGRRPG
ncbi:bifunctional hydroxymethylpyrimidine kinase/phosphomethylpyrimidine kinase [Candidatus Fermentibacterales bacterium]|nr:bifunctional hydroxymethylpyrimidine kinase/phosphomethylpyrimidine kinase [Candidatus Fermentibacterales bacterium]